MECWGLTLPTLPAVPVPLLSASAVSLAASLLYLLRRRRGRKNSKPLPPGPRPLRLLAKLMALQRQSPFDIGPFLRQMHARHGPVISLRLLTHTVFIADRGLAHRVLVRDGAAFADRPPRVEPNPLFNAGSINFAPYGPYWRLVRRNLAAEALHRARVGLFAPARRWACDGLVASLRSGDPGAAVTVRPLLRRAMLDLLLCMCFGVRLARDAVDEIEELERHALLSATAFPVFAFWPAVTKRIYRKRWAAHVAVRQRQHEVYTGLIHAATRDAGGDGDDGAHQHPPPCYAESLLALRVAEEGDRPLTDAEMVSLCSEFINAGTDTTVTLLEWIMAELVNHQDVQAKVYEEVMGAKPELDDIDNLQELPYLKAVVLEGLRLHPPGHYLVPHAVGSDAEIGGYKVPKGAEVNFMVAEIARDEAVWTAAREFRPERFLDGGEGSGVDITGSREIKMMPFGAGRRMCPGYALGMRHAEFFVGTLVREMNWLPPAEGEAVDMAETVDFTIVMKNPLRARISNASGKGKGRLPPGPPALVFLAKFLAQRRSIFDMAPLLRDLHARHGPVISLRLFGRLVVFVADRGLAHRVLVRDGATFADRPPLSEPDPLFSAGDINTAPYGPYWRLVRRNLAADALHHARVGLFAPARRWACDALVSSLLLRASPVATVTVRPFLRRAMFELLVYMCFGARLGQDALDEIEALERHVLASFTVFPVFAFFPPLTKRLFRKRWAAHVAVRRRLDEVFAPLIHAAARRRGEDDAHPPCYAESLLAVRVADDGDRRLTDAEMVSLCSEFINAGTDTTVTLLEWIMAEIVNNPDVQSKVHEEVAEGRPELDDAGSFQALPYLKAVVLEGLRLHPPAHFVIPHGVQSDDAEIGGYAVPKGAEVNFMVAEIGRDEAVWTAAREFRPERFLDGGEGCGVDITGSREIKMMPFGAGRRMCPGYALGMLHAEYFVGSLVRELEWLPPAEGEAIDMAETVDFTTVMKHPLRARIGLHMHYVSGSWLQAPASHKTRHQHCVMLRTSGAGRNICASHCSGFTSSARFFRQYQIAAL
ncbi:hypothetical protein U9M48_020694 [Paspalum notatum var. saurae]|uniref:Cytochrome P450 n=1 Tax=Paspalum notatum var. saurae TaxID=547442 RepID=A0AAQ3TFC9_PASNO